MRIQSAVICHFIGIINANLGKPDYCADIALCSGNGNTQQLLSMFIDTTLLWEKLHVTSVVDSLFL